MSFCHCIPNPAHGVGLKGEESAIASPVRCLLRDEAYSISFGNHAEDALQVIAFKNLTELRFRFRANGQHIISQTVSFPQQQHFLHTQHGEQNFVPLGQFMVERHGGEECFPKQFRADNFCMTDWKGQNCQILSPRRRPSTRWSVMASLSVICTLGKRS